MPRKSPAPDTGFTFGGCLWFICQAIVFIIILRHLLPVLGGELEALFKK